MEHRLLSSLPEVRLLLNLPTCLKGQGRPASVTLACPLCRQRVGGCLPCSDLQVMLTRQHRPPCPLGPEQEIERGRIYLLSTSVCTFLLIYKHWFLGAEPSLESGLKESSLQNFSKGAITWKRAKKKNPNSGKLKLLSLQWLKAPVWGVMPGKKKLSKSPRYRKPL